MSQLATRDKLQQVVDILDREDFQHQLAQALPQNVSLERFVRVTKLAVQLNPDILDTDRASLFRAMVRCAQDGLLPDGREAALVKTRVKGKDVCSYWPMIGGYRKIAAQHGFAIEAHAVYANDAFRYVLGFEPNVEHHPAPLDKERGELIGAYAIGTRTMDERKFVEVMSRDQIEAIRAESPSAKSEWSPWNKHTAEMYRKTAARRIFKQLPLAGGDEITARLSVDDERAVDVASAVVPEVAGLAPLVEDGGEPEVVE